MKIGLGNANEKKCEIKGSAESDVKKGKLARSKSKEAIDSNKVPVGYIFCSLLIMISSLFT